MSEYGLEYLLQVRQRRCEESSHHFINFPSCLSLGPNTIKDGLVTLNVQSILINVNGIGMCIESLLIPLLIVCSTNRFPELFLSWPVATAKSLSLTYSKPGGKPEVS